MPCPSPWPLPLSGELGSGSPSIRSSCGAELSWKRVPQDTCITASRDETILPGPHLTAQLFGRVSVRRTGQ